MSEKISVIIPIYNVEAYIEECLNSIFNQTYKNLELILVDDFSNDNSSIIVEKIIKNKKNVLYIKNPENKGSSYCRNLALKKATGVYISFVDSDDYIDYNYYEKMLTILKGNNASLAVSDIKVFNEKKETIRKCGDISNSKMNFVNNGLAASSCNKLFRKDEIMKYTYNEKRMNEDVSVVLPLLINSKKVVYVSNVYYHYRQHNSSKQNSKFSSSRFDIFDEVNLCLERIKNIRDFDAYKDIIIYQQIIAIILYILPNIDKNNRKYYIKTFAKKSRVYDLISNKTFCKLCIDSGKKRAIYFKMLVKSIELNSYSLFFLVTKTFNILLGIKKKRSIIKSNITIDDLINLAKVQRSLSNQVKSVSVVIPNYNYSLYLFQRIYSILYQTYKISEIIILDDCSTDDSRYVIEKMVKSLCEYIPIKAIYNSKNSGVVFKQWEKGFQESNSDYVWIAEADDYCDKNLLKNIMMPCLSDDDVYLSYANTAYINSTGNIILKSIIPEIDILKSGHWNKSFVSLGLEEIKNYAYLNCTIANVSSVVFKNSNYSDFFKQSIEFKQAGDWLFYLNVMSKGKIAYTNIPLNYYRLHGNNVTSITKKENHLNEIKKIHNYCIKKFDLGIREKEKIEERISFLEDVWEVKNEK